MIVKPQVLIDWEAAGPPKVCFNCDFNIDGRCDIYKTVPPYEFQQTPGGCDQWDCQIPF